MAQMRHFLDVISGKAEPLCSLEDGVKALQLALAAQASQAQGNIIHL
jgi:predicted dehydrogenase